MFNVTTKYVKINDERKKCFMIRDDESYVRTVDVVMTNTTPVSMEYAGFKTTLSVSLHRHRGTSTLTFYDGEEILGMVNTSSSTTTYTLSDVVLAWGVEHDLYAVYNGNKQTLNAKSNKIVLNQPIPEELVTTMEFDNETVQVNGGISSTSLTATIVEPTVSDNTLIYFYDGDTLIDSVGTEDNSATLVMTSPTDGKHNITARVPASSQLNEGSCTCELLVGYNIEVTEYPTNNTFIIGENNIVEVRVRDWSNEPVSSASVSFNSTTATTNSSGIATFTITNISGANKTASYGGSTSPTQTVHTFTPTSIEFSSVPSNTWITRPSAIAHQITATVTGTGDGSIVDTPLTSVITATDYEYIKSSSIREDNIALFVYPTGARGTVEITASLGSISTTRVFSDILYGYNSVFQDVQIEMSIMCETATLPNYYQIIFHEAGSFIRFKGTGNNVKTFQFTCKENSGFAYRVVKGGDAQQSEYYYQFQPSASSTYKFVHNHGTVTVYVNGVETSTFSGGGSDNWEIRSVLNNATLKLSDLRVHK